ncbi:hypothetical protein Hanom_Chr12g01170311 [Helianthus anomalus]
MSSRRCQKYRGFEAFSGPGSERIGKWVENDIWELRPRNRFDIWEQRPSRETTSVEGVASVVGAMM